MLRRGLADVVEWKTLPSSQEGNTTDETVDPRENEGTDCNRDEKELNMEAREGRPRG
jgi:hypothetical protein